MSQNPIDSQAELNQLRALVAHQQQQLQHYQQSSSPSSTVSPPTDTIPFTHDAMSRSNTVPMRANHNGHITTHVRSADDGQRAVKRMRTMSHQGHHVSYPMEATRSHGPFTINGPVSPPPRSRNSALPPKSGFGHLMGRGGSGAWSTDELAEPPAMPRSVSTNFAKPAMEMPTVPEAGPTTSGLQDPAAWLAQNPSFEDQFAADSFGSSVPEYDFEVPHFLTTNASTCGSLTSAPTFDGSPMSAPMSRQNSEFGRESVSGAVHMMRLNSQMSHGTDMNMHYNLVSGQNSPLGKRSWDDALNSVGANHDEPYAYQYATSVPTDGLLVSSTDMERSTSSASMNSVKSNSSLRMRAKDTLKMQNERAKALIKPKPATELKSTESQSHAKTTDGKTAITKQTKYVRPKQPKLFCTECNEYPEGFRGDHELRRHRDAKHKARVKKWICVDPMARGLPVGEPAVNPLSKCKACNKKKRYGAYYNAAAHLRRTHFKEKPSRKPKGSASRNDEDKRGGKGGGDWPPMAELKNWMTEIWVSPDEKDEDEEQANSQQAKPTVDTVIDSSNCTSSSSYTPEFSDVEAKLMSNCGNEGGDSMVSDFDFLNTMPLGNFALPLSPVTPASFSTDPSAYNSPGQMTHLSSAASSNTMTPHTTLDLGELNFDLVYGQ